VKVGTISELIIYPVKSLPGINVDKAVVTDLCLQDASNSALCDRNFLIVNENGVFQHQRILPSMVLIVPRMENQTMYLSNNGTEVAVHIPTFNGSNRKTVRIWLDKVKALDCGDEVANWLTKVTGTTLRLVYHESDKTQRKLAPEERPFPMFDVKAKGTFQDDTSHMLMTEESIAFLNTKLENPVTVRNFRPTMLVKGAPEPWAEDFWNFVRIGDDSNKSVVLKTAKPCQRCRLTTVDPDTGIMREDGEPLKTLTSLQRPVGDEVVTRLVKKTAVMGNHFGVFQNENATIKVGDPVYTAVV